MKIFKGKRWQNWSGSVHCAPQNIYFPTCEQDIIDAIKQTSAKNQKIRVVGSGHSFTPLIETEENIMSLKQYDGIYSIDEEKKEATVKSGTQLRALGQLLSERKWAMENLGDIDCQTIAGAISTGTHGTGLSLGCISTQVVCFTLITANGEVIKCSEAENSDIFKAGQVSLGSLGIISKITLRLIPSYYLKVKKERKSFEKTLEEFEKNINENRHFEFFWLPHTDYTYAKTMNMEKKAKNRGRWRKYLNEIFFENGALFVLGNICRFFPRWSQTTSRWGTSLIPEGEEIDLSCNIFASYRWVKFHEMEYGVPLEKGVSVLREINEWVKENNIPVSFPVEFRIAKKDDIFLSPAYKRDTAFIAVHSFRGVPHKKYFEGCEKIFRKAGGRPHWGKMHTLTANELKKMYPKWDHFQKIRQELDPNGLFLNKYLESIFGLDIRIK